MEFQIGDIVYSEDPLIKENCKNVYGTPAVIWGLREEIYGVEVALRYYNYNYTGNHYHGSQLKYLRHAPALIKELL